MEEEDLANTVEELSHAYQVAVSESCLEPESEEEGEGTDESLVALVHQPGLGVVDTGCGRGLVGETTPRSHDQVWLRH